MIEVNVRLMQDNPPNNSYLPFVASMPRDSKLKDLRQEIHKSWKLHPKEQMLYYNLELTDDQKRLSEYGIDSTGDVLVGVKATASIKL